MKLNLRRESTDLIRNLFLAHEFIDKAAGYEDLRKIDVIIPVLHSNDLWRENLLSFYREIPINRLIIGDAGCIDDTVSVVREFPRVEIIDHKQILTLGASIADLTSRIKTSKFAYLQSDVYLPEGWFSVMEAQAQEFAWVGSPMQVVTMLDYKVDYSGKRPLAGAQLGDTSIFKNLKEFIQDDYVYRQEDFVIEEYVRRQGHQTGNSLDTFHFHQVMRRNTVGMQMNVEGISIKLGESLTERNRVRDTQLYGLLKYCDPKNREVRQAAYAAYADLESAPFSRLISALRLAKSNNHTWLPFLLRFALKSTITKAISLLSNILVRLTDAILGLR